MPSESGGKGLVLRHSCPIASKSGGAAPRPHSLFHPWRSWRSGICRIHYSGFYWIENHTESNAGVFAALEWLEKNSWKSIEGVTSLYVHQRPITGDANSCRTSKNLGTAPSPKSTWKSTVVNVAAFSVFTILKVVVSRSKFSEYWKWKWSMSCCYGRVCLLRLSLCFSVAPW